MFNHFQQNLPDYWLFRFCPRRRPAHRARNTANRPTKTDNSISTPNLCWYIAPLHHPPKQGTKSTTIISTPPRDIHYCVLRAAVCHVRSLMHMALIDDQTVGAMEVETTIAAVIDTQPTPLEASAHAPPNYFESRHQPPPPPLPSPPRRADTPCPAALQADRAGRRGAKNLSFVLLPDEGIPNWGIGLPEGSTVVRL